MTEVVLGVDLGTTATKVVATRLDGRVVATAEHTWVQVDPARFA